MCTRIPLSCWLALVGIALVAIVLRVAELGHSLWLDELHTAWAVGGDAADVWTRSATGNQTPIYFALVWLLTQLVGASEVTLRLPSLVASLAVLPLAAWGVWRWSHSVVAVVVTVLLLTLDRQQLFYAQDARPYAVLQCVALLQVVAFIEVLRRPARRWRSVLIVTTIALVYLHLTAALLPLAEGAVYGIYLLMHRRGAAVPEEAYRWSRAGIDAAIVLVATLPLAALAQVVFARRASWELFIHRPTIESMLALPGAMVFLVAVPLGLIGAAWRRRANQVAADAVVWAPWGLLAGVYALTVGAAWLLAMTDLARLCSPRYLFLVGALPALVAGGVVSFFPGRLWQVTAGGLLIACQLSVAAHSPLVASWQTGSVSGHALEDWRGAVRAVEERDPTEELPVLVRSGLIECDAVAVAREAALPDIADSYCLLPVNSLYDLSARRGPVLPLAYDEPWSLSPAASEALRTRREAILLLRGNDVYARLCVERLTERLAADGWELELVELQHWPGRPGVCTAQIRITDLSSP